MGAVCISTSHLVHTRMHIDPLVMAWVVGDVSFRGHVSVLLFSLSVGFGADRDRKGGGPGG